MPRVEKLKQTTHSTASNEMEEEENMGAKRWWMHETFKNYPGDRWGLYQTPAGKVHWWNRQTEEWIYRPGGDDLPGEAWKQYRDLATGRIGCYNMLTGEWFFRPGGEDPRTWKTWL